MLSTGLKFMTHMSDLDVTAFEILEAKCKVKVADFEILEALRNYSIKKKNDILLISARKHVGTH